MTPKKLMEELKVFLKERGHKVIEAKKREGEDPFGPYRSKYFIDCRNYVYMVPAYCKGCEKLEVIIIADHE